MIRYALKCPNGHLFDSWFQNADAFDTLAAAGRIVCPECGAADVEKSLMAPDVRPARSEAPAPENDAPDAAPLSRQSEREKAIAELRKRVETESDYVGATFVREARAIHSGEAPERSIYGEAKPQDAIELVEDGIPVVPLPFRARRKAN